MQEPYLGEAKDATVRPLLRGVQLIVDGKLVGAIGSAAVAQ